MKSTLNSSAAPTKSAGSLTDWVENRAGQNAVETTDQLLAAAEARVDLNVFITVSAEQARAQAEASDAHVLPGKPRALEGVPLAIKDNFCTKDIRTTAGSKILENFVPSYESTVTARLLAAGAVILGKANMDEFGMGSSTENSAFGPTQNPTAIGLGFDDRVPGGSSGGSAAAVAADLCFAAVGTDTGGSIRQPASFCGVVGFKPSYGTCSRWGIVAYGSSLDQAGVIANTVPDVAAMMDVIAGHDAKDSTSHPTPASGFAQALQTLPEDAVIGIPKSFRETSSNADLDRLWDDIEHLLKRSNAKVEYIDLPTVKHSLPAYYVIALCEASSNLARYDGVRYGHRSQKATTIEEVYEMSRAEGFGDEVKRRIMLGTFALSAGYYDQYYLRAAKTRAKIASEFADAFTRVNWMVWPTAPTPAFRFGDHAKDPVSMYLEDLYTVPVNLAGLPAVSIPGLTAGSGLPMGIQIVGKAGSDTSVLAMANRLEAALATAR